MNTVENCVITGASDVICSLAVVLPENLADYVDKTIDRSPEAERKILYYEIVS